MTVLASPVDVHTLAAVVRHLRRAANHDFAEVVLVLDTLPPHTPDKTTPLIELAETLMAEGTVSKIVRLSEQQPSLEWFAELPGRTRDHRGIPIMGWVAGIAATTCPYVCHFDSDILMHSSAGHSWIAQSIACLEDDKNALFVAPHPGPPTPEGRMQTVDWQPKVGLDGHWRFKEFVCRRYVVSRERLANLLPLQPRHISWKRKIAMHLGGRSSLLTWEEHMSHAVALSSYWGVWLSDPRAWSLHCPDHGPVWKEMLPALIEAVEAGRYPPEQVGQYDLQLEAWLRMMPRGAAA